MPHKRKPKSGRVPAVIGAPPGLEAEVQYDNCQREQQEFEIIDVVELARRLQRLELLLFNVPEPDFGKIDQHINQILSRTLGNESAECASQNVGGSLNCEVFSISDELNAHGEDVDTLPSGADRTIYAEIVALQVKYDDLSKNLEMLRTTLEERKQGEKGDDVEDFKEPDPVNKNDDAHLDTGEPNTPEQAKSNDDTTSNAICNVTNAPDIDVPGCDFSQLPSVGTWLHVQYGKRFAHNVITSTGIRCHINDAVNAPSFDVYKLWMRVSTDVFAVDSPLRRELEEEAASVLQGHFKLGRFARKKYTKPAKHTDGAVNRGILVSRLDSVQQYLNIASGRVPQTLFKEVLHYTQRVISWMKTERTSTQLAFKIAELDAYMSTLAKRSLRDK